VLVVEKLADLGYRWRTVVDRHPQFTLRSAVRAGAFVYVSGQIPVQEDGTVVQGQVGNVGAPASSWGLSSSQQAIIAGQAKAAAAAARLCAVASLYAAATAVDSPEDIVGVANMFVFVRSTPYFNDPSTVAEGASHLFRQVLGEEGVGARTAIGVSALPHDGVVEITVTFLVK
jgi:enamine deaminase RidA (YjgF/YER057c/UK114 family)